MLDCHQGFAISPRMQELMVYAGHIDCYGKCNEILKHFLSIEVSAAQVYRVTNSVSESLEAEDEKVERNLPPIEKSDVLYAEMDGSMICTRADKWKEVKLARLFKGSHCLNPNSSSSYLTESQYVALFGDSDAFGRKLQLALSEYGELKNRLIFITDGATWIKEWIADKYPLAVAILDYYQACEHLHQFADTVFKDQQQQKERWCKQQKELLLESKLNEVLDNIEAIGTNSGEKTKLLNYYQNNKERMDYKRYRTIGCGIIGSGAIESAHRTVIQRRMKLSGQRWTKQAAKNMLRLRVFSMNRQWGKVVEIIKYPVKNIA
jgi:hypothetical protein